MKKDGSWRNVAVGTAMGAGGLHLTRLHSPWSQLVFKALNVETG